MRIRFVPLVFVVLAGCSGNQPSFPELHPVKGVVKRGGQPVKRGAVTFNPDPARPEFLINSEVGEDGTYTLSTVRTTDSKGQRKPGAPEGKYKVTYTPPLGDQTAGGEVNPIELAQPVSVKAGDNDIPLEVPKR